MKNKILIYYLSDPISGEIRYVGQTSKTLEERLKIHLRDANYKKNNRRVSWIKSIVKKGFIPRIEFIEEVNCEEWQFWEMYWIEQFKAWGFNLTNGTKGGDGGALIGESYEKMKQKLKGRKFSKETRKK